MFRRLLVGGSLLVAVGCRSDLPWGRFSMVTPCTGADPGPVPSFPAYRMAETPAPTGGTWALNRAWDRARSVPVNVDVGSFAATSIAPDALLDSVERAIAFWNAAPAAITLTLGDTALECCTTSDTSDCRVCGAGDEHVDVFLAPAADAWGRPAYTEHTKGDDPDTEELEYGCLVASDVIFFPAGLTQDLEQVAYRWVNLDDDVVDLDVSDGLVDKPFHNTLVHELGHVLGLGDQDDATVACSVMSHCADPRCGCDWEWAGPVDEAALSHVYGG